MRRVSKLSVPLFLVLWLRQRRPRLAHRLSALLLRSLGRISRSPRLQLAGRTAYAKAVGITEPSSVAQISSIDTCTVGEGDVLRGSLLLPAGSQGPFPTVILRTPYGRKEEF